LPAPITPSPEVSDLKGATSRSPGRANTNACRYNEVEWKLHKGENL